MYRNRPIPLYLRAVYLLCRVLAWLGVTVFYRRRAVLGKAHARFDGPAIVIVNHPSTLLDVLHPGLLVRQEMYFLANYGLFKNPVSNWIFRRLFCIPVKRREDVGAGETRDNDAAFEASYQHLEQGGVLFIAPEGTSFVERVLREFRTGAARIACGVEARNDWKLGLKIVPFGLSYSAPWKFRSEVVVAVGAPVDVSDWAETWRHDPAAAADDLTAELRRRVQALVIDARSEAGDHFLRRLETMLQAHRPLSLPAAFERSQALTHAVLDDMELQTQVQTYGENLDAAGLSEAGLAAWENRAAAWWEPLFLLLGLAPAALGAAVWLLPCALPWLLERRLKLYIGYSSTIKILAGLITFPIALAVIYRLGAAWGGAMSGLAALTLAIGLGYFAERYADVWRRFAARRNVAAASCAAIEQLLMQRTVILQHLEAERAVGV